jgi:PAS domain-containing protein
LITELAEAIILVLSSECKVLFCGTAVTELLGWRDEDLIDGDLIELINGERISALEYYTDEATKRRTDRTFEGVSMNRYEQGTNCFVMPVSCAKVTS